MNTGPGIDLPIAFDFLDIDSDALLTGAMIGIPLFLFFLVVGLALGKLYLRYSPVDRVMRQHFGVRE